MRLGIVASRFNEAISGELLKRAREELLDKGRRAERIEKWLAAYERRLRRQFGAPVDEQPGATAKIIPLQPAQ